jgi:hypothetical protein
LVHRIPTYFPAALEPGKIYELVYTSKDPVVVSLGAAGDFDQLAFPALDPTDGTRQTFVLRIVPRTGLPGV